MGKYFDMLMEDVRMKEGLHACMNCGVCTGVCPAAEFYNYDPRQIVCIVQTRDDDAIDMRATLLPLAEKAARRLGVDPRYLVAQAALETGWGASIIQGETGSSHNLFGIKAHGGWQGASAETLTTEYYNGQPVKESARFRAYDSFAQSFEDYADFLQGNGRYQEALKSADNPDKFMSELQKAGYATDPQYASKVNQIARQLQTYQMVAAAGSNKNS